MKKKTPPSAKYYASRVRSLNVKVSEQAELIAILEQRLRDRDTDPLWVAVLAIKEQVIEIARDTANEEAGSVCDNLTISGRY